MRHGQQSAKTRPHPQTGWQYFAISIMMFPPTFGGFHSITRPDHLAMRDFRLIGRSLSGVTSRTRIPVADHSNPFHAMPEGVGQKAIDERDERKADAYCVPY
jgi:hypothetical protein